MNFIQLNDIVNVQAYKSDGSLYRQYNGLKVIEMSSEYCVLLAIGTKVSKKNDRKWKIKNPTFWFFPFSSSFTCNMLVSATNSSINYYINIASPFVYEDGNFKFIDYDLDVKISENNAFKILDTNEFLQNAKKYKYSQKIKDLIYDSLKALIQNIIEKKGIFDVEHIRKNYYEKYNIFYLNN